MNNNLKLEELCHGQLTFYDKDKNVKCGNRLKYKFIKCDYLENTYCNNEFETRIIFQYLKK
ncbi:MAG: hypothetical protein ACTSRG_23935 [Candidatus Helarchaeota archaeon]